MNFKIAITTLTAMAAVASVDAVSATLANKEHAIVSVVRRNAFPDPNLTITENCSQRCQTDLYVDGSKENLKKIAECDFDCLLNPARFFDMTGAVLPNNYEQDMWGDRGNRPLKRSIGILSNCISWCESIAYKLRQDQLFDDKVRQCAAKKCQVEFYTIFRTSSLLDNSDEDDRCIVS